MERLTGLVKVIVSLLISLLQFVPYLFKQFSIFLLSGYKEIERINAKREDTKNQENDEITKT